MITSKLKNLAAVGIFAISAGIFSPSVSAEVVTGYAAIVNNDIEKAREQARDNAMRTFVEKEIGVEINASMEVSMGMVVRDTISKESNGYVKLNRVISETWDDGIFTSKIDVSASTKLMNVDLDDVRSGLQALSENSQYNGVSVAVSGRDENNRAMNLAKINYYVEGKIQESGFRAVVNDTVRSYMDKTTDFSDLRLTAEVRRLARENREAEENAILRGTFDVINMRSTRVGYVATVNASFELVGLDSNYVASFSDYFSAVGKSQTDAISNAQELAIRSSIESIGQKILEYEQISKRGGVSHIKTTLIIRGTTNDSQRNAIRQQLQAINCKVIRTSLSKTGEFKIAVDAQYSNLEDLKQAILNATNMNESYGDEDAYGSEKLYFSL